MGIEVTIATHAEVVAAYQAALAPLGYTLQMSFGGEDFPEHPGVIGAGLGDGPPDFWIIAKPEFVSPHAIHFAFRASSRALVRETYEAAIKAGFTPNGEPGLRAGTHPNYYAAFFKDQHLNRVEVVCHLPEDS